MAQSSSEHLSQCHHPSKHMVPFPPSTELQQAVVVSWHFLLNNRPQKKSGSWIPHQIQAITWITFAKNRREKCPMWFLLGNVNHGFYISFWINIRNICLFWWYFSLTINKIVSDNSRKNIASFTFFINMNTSSSVHAHGESFIAFLQWTEAPSVARQYLYVVKEMSSAHINVPIKVSSLWTIKHQSSYQLWKVFRGEE